MGQVGRRVAAAMLVLAAAACGTASGAATTLASYATGTWACTWTATVNGHAFTIKPKGTVASTSSTTGTVQITIPPAPPFPGEKLSGQWSLTAGELMVTWSKRDQGTTQAKPISLETTHFRIRSGTAGNAKWTPVTVDRKARSVGFGFPLDASEPGGPQGSMVCRKP